MSTRTPFALQLKQYRKLLHLTQAVLASASGYSISTVRKLETGELCPSRDIVLALARALDLDDEEQHNFDALARRAHVARLAPPVVNTVPARAGMSHTVLSPATALIGRANELARVRTLLIAPSTRLVTLTGPGGVGKTRLALAVADTVVDGFANGVPGTRENQQSPGIWDISCDSVGKVNFNRA